jgi:hypothetical protein
MWNLAIRGSFHMICPFVSIPSGSCNISSERCDYHIQPLSRESQSSRRQIFQILSAVIFSAHQPLSSGPQITKWSVHCIFTSLLGAQPHKPWRIGKPQQAILHSAGNIASLGVPMTSCRVPKPCNQFIDAEDIKASVSSSPKIKELLISSAHFLHVYIFVSDWNPII